MLSIIFPPQFQKASLLLAIALFSGRALANTSVEHMVKASLIYNFASYVEPAEGQSVPAKSTFTLCVVGAEELKEALTAVEGKTAGGKVLSVQYLQYPLSASAAQECDEVFLAGSSANAAEAERMFQAKPVLTVTEQANVGIVTLGVEDDKLRFDINLNKARDSKLSISSKLLRLARRVEQ